MRLARAVKFASYLLAEAAEGAGNDAPDLKWHFAADFDRGIGAGTVCGE